MKGYEGFVTLYNETKWEGGTVFSPLVLPLDTDALKVGKDYQFKPHAIGAQYPTQQMMVSSRVTPGGDIGYEFSSENTQRILMSHFQLATRLASGETHYSFSPNTANLDFAQEGTNPTGYWGSYHGQVYSVAMAKVGFTAAGSPNVFVFRNGLCDKFKIDINADSRAFFTASMRFKSVETGSTYGSIPSELTGSFLSRTPFESWEGTAEFSGYSGPGIVGLSITSERNFEERAILGHRDPLYFQPGEHMVTGEVTLDVNRQSFALFEDMLTKTSMSIAATLYKDINDSIEISLPYVFLKPYELQNPGGNTEWTTRIPFVAYTNGTLPPITINVISDQALANDEYIFDAWSVARGTGFGTYDADAVERNIETYATYNRMA